MLTDFRKRVPLVSYLNFTGEMQPQKVWLGEEAQVLALHEDLGVADICEGRVHGHDDKLVIRIDLESRSQHLELMRLHQRQLSTV